jgi:hypothetical protein
MPPILNTHAVSKFLPVTGFNRIAAFGTGKLIPALNLFTTGISVAKALRGGASRDKPSIVVPGINFGKEKQSDFLESLFLKIPDTKVQGRRKLEKVFQDRQNPIDFGIKETQRRLSSLGLEEDLGFFNEEIGFFKSVKHEFGTSQGLNAQQLQLDAIKNADLQIAAKQKELGFTTEQTQEFNRQSQERAFDFNVRGFRNLVARQSAVENIATEDPGGVEGAGLGAEPIFRGLGTGKNPELGSEVSGRLAPFQKEFFPQLSPQSTSKKLQTNLAKSGVDASVNKAISGALGSLGLEQGGVSKTSGFTDQATKSKLVEAGFGNVSNAQEALQGRGPFAERSQEVFDIVFPGSDAVTKLRAPGADITNFLNEAKQNKNQLKRFARREGAGNLLGSANLSDLRILV